MGKFRSKLKGKAKGKKWLKGQSSVSNPKTTKFRQIAKSRFFQENLGNTGLTKDALSKHNYITTYAHGKKLETNENDLPILKEFETMSVRTENEDEGESSEYSGCTFKTFQTFASDWSTCSNVSFSKLLKRFDSNNALHKDMLAVLAAVTEVLKENGGKESTTEYFAALMETLKASDTQEGTAATLSLLAMGIKSVPQGVLRKQFSECASVFLDLLEKQDSNDSGAAVLRSIIGCLSVLLRAQDYTSWSDSSTMRIFDTLLAFTIHTKPKVRKASQHAVTAVLLGSCFMIPSNETASKVPQVHPAADRAAQFCLKQMTAEALLNGHRMVLHALALLADIIAAFSNESIKSCCEAVLSLMTTSSVVVRVRGLHTLHALLAAPTSNVRAPLVARLLRALHVARPQAGDKNLARAWIAVIHQGLSCLAKLDMSVCMTCVLPFVNVCVTELWLADSTEVHAAATNALKVVIMDCLKPVFDVEELYRKHKSTIESVLKTIQSGLDNPFNQALRHVILTIAVCFEVANKGVAESLRPLLIQLNERRESHNFEHAREVEYACGCAVKAIGPQFVLECIPLRRDKVSLDVDRSWLLPVLKEKIQNSTLKFFATEIIEMATFCRKKSRELSQANNVPGSHTYDLLCNQLWALFPSFCNNPTDTKDNFKSIAKVLGMVLKDNPEFRLSIMQGLRRLIASAENNEEEKNELGRYAKNFLPMLLNIYSSPVKGSTAEGQRLAALETIQVYLTVTPQQLREELYSNAIVQLEASKENHCHRESVLDILRIMVLYQSAEKIAELFEKWVYPLAESVVEDPRKSKKNKQKGGNEEKADDGGKSALKYKERLRMCEMEHKKAYRILEEIFKCEKPNCKQFVKKEHKKIKALLTSSLNKAADSSKAARLRCIEHLILNTPYVSADTKLVKGALAEAVICTKDINSKCRQCAFSLINTIAKVLKDHHNEMSSFVEMLLSGLSAPLPRVVGATVRSIAAVLYNYSEDLGLETVQSLLEKVTELMKNSSREITDACLSFLKVYTKILPIPVLGGSLPIIMTSLSAMAEDCKRHARVEIGYLLNRLLRKFGSQTIEQLVPKSDEVMLKRLRNLRKLESRKKRQRDTQRTQSESGDDEFDLPSKGTSKTLDEILADSDSDMEFMDEAQQSSKPSKKGGNKNKSWIQDDPNSIVDLADAGAARNITATNPLQMKQKEERAKISKKKDGGFKMAPDGRLIITDDDDGGDDYDEEPKASGDIASDSDDTDDDDKPERSSKLLKAGGKRRYDDILSLKSNKSGKSKASTLYKPGGKGIHRPVASSGVSVRSATSLGTEFRAKKARGDMKKPGKHEPYAYLPLSRKNLNKRKRAMTSNQFKGVVKSKNKGGGGKKRK